jgi:hypothetical protein
MENDILSKWVLKVCRSRYTHASHSRLQDKIRRDKEGHCTLTKGTSHQEEITQLAKTLGPSYYCLYSFFDKIRDKGKIVSAR